MTQKAKPIALYSLAHSDPRGSPGAAVNGVCERNVSRVALIPFQHVLESAGFEVKAFKGRVNPQIRAANRAIKAMRKAGRPWVSVALHFNSTPMLPCPRCEAISVAAGLPCPDCGHVIRWQFGHKAMVFKHSVMAVELAHIILDRLSGLIPGSVRREPILMPDPKYGAIWPATVAAPAVLVEAGFIQDPAFVDWISDPIHHSAYGQAVAESILTWYRTRKGFDHWGD